MQEGQSSSLTSFFQRLRAGDRTAAQELWSHYFPRSLGLARKVLHRHRLPVLDAEDVAQSAFVSWWRRTERGDFAGHLDRNELWRILATITVRKARRNIAREMTEKRGSGRVQNESAVPVENGVFRLDESLGSVPIEHCDLSCEELLQQLKSEELQEIALFKLMNYTNREIAEMLDCTERKVERKLRIIREIWLQHKPARNHD